jgi:hypothetical protein
VKFSVLACSIIVLSMPAEASRAAQAEKAKPASVFVLEQGSRSGIINQRLETVRDKVAWRAFWQEHGKGLSPAPPLPEVDFSREMLVVAFAGQKTTGGYQLNLVGFKPRKTQITISLSLTQPGPDCIVAQASTQPYVIAKVAQSNKPANFRLSAKTFSCLGGPPW